MIDASHRPPDPGRPVVGVDTGGRQPIGDARGPLTVRVGSTAKEDGGYARPDAPRHGSWLKTAGFGLSVLARQCPDRRIPGRATLTREVAGWGTRRNHAGAAAEWPFTIADARVRLKKRYPKTQLQ